MSGFLVIAFLFFIGCTAGWVLELFFRRFFSHNNSSKKWINPGFLNGPYLPLYGSGLVTLYLIASADDAFLGHSALKKVVVFIVMAVMMTLIEYLTGLIFIKRMNVKLWDYSDEWGNIDGIICPKFSLAWALLGAAYYLFVHPHVLAALRWLSENLAFSFVIGFFYGIFVIDVFYSFNVLGKIRAFADENEIVVRYDELKEHIIEKRREREERIRFLFTFSTPQPLIESLRTYHEKLLEDIKSENEMLVKRARESFRSRSAK